ncbi:hypothetical protein Tco_1308760, partial [Tanacetum coccineum]
DGMELDYLVTGHVVVVFRARQHPMQFEYEELEVLELQKRFLEQLMVNHPYSHHT